MDTRIIPASIKADRNVNMLTIHWKDGHVSEYPFWLLRFACPCAECRGGHDQMSGQPPQEIFDLPPEDSSRTKLEHVEAVGSYALGLQWNDGHSAGIYDWRYLRLLCPCVECRGE
jgi:DUF971 family protein